MNQTDRQHTRREFFRGVARGAALTALAAGAAVVALRARRSSGCTDGGRCSGCGSLARCDLPQAMVTRDGGRDR